LIVEVMGSHYDKDYMSDKKVKKIIGLFVFLTVLSVVVYVFS